MPEVRLNWSTAEVTDAELTVELEGAIPSNWKQSFKTTEKLLGGGTGEWDKVRLKKQTVRVSDVSPGSEDQLRHHLESLVEQANATTRPPDPNEAENEGDSERTTADEQMAKRFRSFKEPQPQASDTSAP